MWNGSSCYIVQCLCVVIIAPFCVGWVGHVCTCIGLPCVVIGFVLLIAVSIYRHGVVK